MRRRGVAAVLAHELRLGRVAAEQTSSDRPCDVISTLPDGGTMPIHVKVRADGVGDFFISHNEVLTSKNVAPKYRLALVQVSDAGPMLDEVRYLSDPFTGTDLGDIQASGLRGDWTRLWARGAEPF